MTHGMKRFIIPFLLLGASLLTNIYANAYAAHTASNPVSDIVLTNTPVFDVDQIFVFGSILLVLSIVIVCSIHPQTIPFVLYSLALFYFIRAGFVSLTHLAPYPDQSPIYFHSDFATEVSKLLFGGGLFFSGHTGAPFLIALAFWQKKLVRYFFIAWSIFFATIVLLGHMHYSIDVASAYFITYAVYHLAMQLFRKEYEVFLNKR